MRVSGVGRWMVLGAAFLMLAVGVFLLPGRAMARAKVVDLPGMAYNTDASLQDNLAPLTGKFIFVTLDSGKTYAGWVKKVGRHFLHLEKLQRKDFYDALIRIEDISAIEAKFRDFQR